MTVAELLDSYNCRIASLVHPTVNLGYVEMGRGCLVHSGCVINVGTRMGDFVSVLSNCVVGHNVTIEDYAFLGPMTSVGRAINRAPTIALNWTRKKSLMIPA